MTDPRSQTASPELRQIALDTVLALDAAGRLGQMKIQTKEEVITAVRGIESALLAVRATLGLPAFTGLPNLTTSTAPFHGINVRAKYADRKIVDDAPARHHLILSAHGELVMANFRWPALGYRKAENADLELDDIGKVAAAAMDLLDRQLQDAITRERRLTTARDLASRVRVALAEALDTEVV